MSIGRVRSTTSTFSRRNLGLAGLAAILGCAACCALPFLAAAGIGGGAAAALGRVLRPGSEIVVGGIVFVAALAVFAVRNRLKRRASDGPSCEVNRRTPQTRAT
jgi:hypothetical protein